MARLPENPVPLAAEPARGNIDPERGRFPVSARRGRAP